MTSTFCTLEHMLVFQLFFNTLLSRPNQEDFYEPFLSNGLNLSTNLRFSNFQKTQEAFFSPIQARSFSSSLISRKIEGIQTEEGILMKIAEGSLG